MEFHQLEIFAAVAEHKSFSKAADALFLSQPTVSSHIKNLEKELHTTLLIRSTSEVRLSPDGETFLWYTKRMLETKSAALDALSTHIKKTIHLGASTIPSSCLLPSLIRGFQKQHPNIIFNIHQGDSSQILDLILCGTLEVGIIGSNSHHPKCSYTPLCQDEIILIAPVTEHYKSLKAKGATVDQLLDEPFILREEGSGTRKAVDPFLKSIKKNRRDLNVLARTNDTEAIKEMVSSGMGVSISSYFSVKEEEQHKKLLVFHFDPPIHRYFYLVSLKNRYKNNPLHEFTQYVQKTFNKDKEDFT